MIRFVIIGGVIAVAFTLYSLVDAAMSEASRARGVSKPVWVVLTVALPVIGGILWFTIGKGPTGSNTARPRAAEDDPSFSGKRMSNAELDEHMRELEERLRELDAETYPGENRGDRRGVSEGENVAGGSAAGSDTTEPPAAESPDEELRSNENSGDDTPPSDGK